MSGLCVWEESRWLAFWGIWGERRERGRRQENLRRKRRWQRIWDPGRGILLRVRWQNWTDPWCFRMTYNWEGVRGVFEWLIIGIWEGVQLSTEWSPKVLNFVVWGPHLEHYLQPLRGRFFTRIHVWWLSGNFKYWYLKCCQILKF